MQITRGHREVPDPKAVVRRLEDGGGRGAAVLALGVQLEGLNLRVVERTHESRAMSPASASSVWGFEAKPVPASCMQVSTMIWSQPAVGTASSEAKQPAGTSENLRFCEVDR